MQNLFEEIASVSNESVFAADIAEPLILWIAVGVISALLLGGLIVFIIKRSIFAGYVKYAGTSAVIIAAAVSIAMLALEIAKHYSDAYADENYLNKTALVQYVLVPIIVICAIVLVGSIVAVLTAKFKKTAMRPIIVTFGCLTLAAVIAAAITIGIYYSANIANDGYYNSDTASVDNVALYITAPLLAAVIVAIAFLFDGGKTKGFDTKTITYAAICIAMSFALSYARLFKMPQGGSITLASMLPLMIFSYMYGTKKGVFVGLIYGVLQAVQDPFIIQPAQFLLDYPIAFSAIGLAGIFSHFKSLEKIPQLKFALGAAVASLLRFAAHVLAGVFAFSAYAGDTNAFIYSMGYNSFVFIDILIAIAAGVILFSSKSFVHAITHIGTMRYQSHAQRENGCVSTDADRLDDTDTTAKDDQRT